MMGTLEGGCLCEAVRYQAIGAPKWVVHCHCRSCRKATGAAFASFAGFQSDKVSFTKDRPAEIESSPGAFRQFCGKCGTSIAFYGDNWPGEIHLHVGALDEPEILKPQAHIQGVTKMPWLHLEDGLPVFQTFPEDEKQ